MEPTDAGVVEWDREDLTQEASCLEEDELTWHRQGPATVLRDDIELYTLLLAGSRSSLRWNSVLCPFNAQTTGKIDRTSVRPLRATNGGRFPATYLGMQQRQ
jgi:hypothetical protein